METPNLAALNRAIEIFGSRRALARALGISQVAVGQWFFDLDNKGHRDVPPRQCVRIENLTQGRVKRRELRPQDWREWWGAELAESQEKEAPEPASQARIAINSDVCEATP